MIPLLENYRVSGGLAGLDVIRMRETGKIRVRESFARLPALGPVNCNSQTPPRVTGLVFPGFTPPLENLLKNVEITEL